MADAKTTKKQIEEWQHNHDADVKEHPAKPIRAKDFFAGIGYLDTDIINIRVFSDKEADKGKNYSFILNEWENHTKELKLRNNEMKGIFYVVNKGGHSAKQITDITAHYVDIDNVPLKEQWKMLESFALPPSFIIRTNKSLHAYWKIKDGKLDAFKEVQLRLIQHFKSDRKVQDLSRVMRVPGFEHCKHVPIMVDVVKYEPELIYTQEQLCAELPQLEKKKIAAEQMESTSNIEAQKKSEQWLDEWLTQNNIVTTKKNDILAGTSEPIIIYPLQNVEDIPWRNEYEKGEENWTPGSTSIAIRQDGRICIIGFHDHDTRENAWHEFRLFHEPGAYDQKEYKPKKRRVLTIEHLISWLKNHNISIRYDAVLHTVDICGLPNIYNSEQLNEHAHIIIYDQIKTDFACNKDLVKDYLSIIAGMNTYNPVVEILNSVTWDGVDREQELIYDIMKISKDDNLSYSLIHKWLLQALSMVCNTIEHPYGADGVLVIQGAQGIGKTSLAQKLGITPNLVKVGLYINPKEKDTLIRSTSCWIAEIGELESTLRSDMEKLKAFFTAPIDIIRVPYGHADIKSARRTSFIATCNSDRFLIDETGNRRFWTIPCAEKFDLEKLRNFDALQLWKQMSIKLKEVGLQGFRLEEEEIKELAERNGHKVKLIKAQAEIMDIIESGNDTKQYKYAYVTVSELKNHYDTLKGYSVEQIGKALDIVGIKQEQKRLPGRPAPQRVRYVPIPLSYADYRRANAV